MMMMYTCRGWWYDVWHALKVDIQSQVCYPKVWHALVKTLMFDDLIVTSSVDEQLDQQYWCLIWQWWHGQKDDVAVISIGMIWQWLECRGYQQQSLVCDRSIGLTISFLLGWQYGARKGGRSLLLVETGKLGSGSFLQVVACKSGGRSLLPVEARKLKSIY